MIVSFFPTKHQTTPKSCLCFINFAFNFVLMLRFDLFSGRILDDSPKEDHNFYRCKGYNDSTRTKKDD